MHFFLKKGPVFFDFEYINNTLKVKSGNLCIFNSVLKCFDKYVWILFLVTFFLIFMLLKNFDKRISYVRISWKFFETLTRQSIENLKLPEKYSIKILYLFWLIFCTLFTTIFSNSIYSQMLTHSNSDFIDTIEKLVEQKEESNLIIMITEDTSTYYLLKVNLIIFFR